MKNDMHLEILNLYEMYKKNRGFSKEDVYRQGIHLCPPIGWMNDPNGASYYKGMHYIYYQYSPFNVDGGLKHWGLYRTKDFCTYEECGMPMIADLPEDVHGVYSGTAFVEEETMHFFYTGNVKHVGFLNYDYEGREHNTLYATSIDGIHIEKKGGLILDGAYPSFVSKHTRDPKVWKHEGIYYMILGARTNDDRGTTLLYRNTQCLSEQDAWEYCFEFISEETMPKEFGYMWECPDYTNIDGEEVFILSPQGLEQEGALYQNVYQSGYFFGKWNTITKHFDITSQFYEFDYGFDFYAPQTYRTEDGRTILWGWMGLPDVSYTNPTIEDGWQHCLTLPRELSYSEKYEKISQKPLKELEKLREDIQYMSGKEFTFEGERIELYGTLSHQTDFVVTCNEVYICYDKTTGIFEVLPHEAGSGRERRYVTLPFIGDIHLVIDHSSIEIFINEGTTVFSLRMYSNRENGRRKKITYCSKEYVEFTIHQLMAFQIEEYKK